MKSKTPLKILTLAFFVTLLSGFVLYQSGCFFHEEKQIGYIPDPNGGTGMDPLDEKDFGLNTFQKLKLSGAFDPEDFDTVYDQTIHFGSNYQDLVLLSSSKSMVVVSPWRMHPHSERYKSSFEIQLEKQLRIAQPFKK